MGEGGQPPAALGFNSRPLFHTNVEPILLEVVPQSPNPLKIKGFQQNKASRVIAPSVDLYRRKTVNDIPQVSHSTTWAVVGCNIDHIQRCGPLHPY